MAVSYNRLWKLLIDRKTSKADQPERGPVQKGQRDLNHRGQKYDQQAD